MGKNPNAKKNKVQKKGGEKKFSNDVETLEEEAHRRGCEIWELDEVRKEQDELDDDSDSDIEEKKSEEEDDH